MYVLVILMTISGAGSISENYATFSNHEDCVKVGFESKTYIELAFNNSDKMAVSFKCVKE